MNQQLRSLREDIKRITLQIFDLISKRLEIAKAIGEIKREKGLDIEDKFVEAQLRSLILKECNKLGINQRFASHLLSLLIKESVQIQMGESISPPDILAKANYLESQGKSVIHLELDEPNFLPSQFVIDALHDALKSPYPNYTEASGLYELREAIAKYINEKFKVDLSSKNVIITLGRKYTTFIATCLQIIPGSEIILFQPSYLSYQPWFELMGGRIIKIPTYLKDDWSPNLTHINEIINDSTCMIILNNPNNPTGKIIDSHTLRAIVDLARDYNLQILSDESYSNYTFTEFKSLLQFENCKSIVIGSFPINLIGIELCYAISDSQTIEKMINLQSALLMGMPKFIQYVALKSIECKSDIVKNFEIMLKRREVATKALAKLPFDFKKPDGGIFIFAKANIDNFNSEKFSNDLLEKKGVAIMPGTIFGNYPNCIRLSLYQSEELILEGIKRIGELIL